jgi:hypothetical protein
VERVSPFGSVQGDDSDVTALLVFDQWHDVFLPVAARTDPGALPAPTCAVAGEHGTE